MSLLRTSVLMEMINFHISHWHLQKMIQMTRVNHVNFRCPETREWLSSRNEVTYLTAMKHALVLAWKILFLHTFQEKSVTVNIIGLRNFDFPTMKIFKGEKK